MPAGRLPNVCVLASISATSMSVRGAGGAVSVTAKMSADAAGARPPSPIPIVITSTRTNLILAPLRDRSPPAPPRRSSRYEAAATDRRLADAGITLEYQRRTAAGALGDQLGHELELTLAP